jgi:hypothetical protein
MFIFNFIIFLISNPAKISNKIWLNTVITAAPIKENFGITNIFQIILKTVTIEFIFNNFFCLSVHIKI